MANLSILGLYKHNTDVFANFELPTALVSEKENIVNNILAECAELEILYPDYDFMKDIIGVWSHKQKPIWTKLYETTQFEYNPIWNKDGKVTEIENDNISRSEQNNGAASSQANTESTTENKVSAFNDASNYNPESKAETDGEAKTITTSTQNTSGEDKHSRTYQRLEQGNIGVTTTQSMIQEERDIDLFNIVDVIVNDFKNRFCILVY